MTRHPYGPDELDRVDADLDAVAHELERYAAGQDADVPPGLAAAIHDAIAAEPDPRVGWWQRFVAGPAAWGATGRAVAVAGVITLALAGSIAVGQVLNVLGPNVGSSPAPSPSVSPSDVSTPSASPSPSPSPSPTPTLQPTPTTAPSTPTASPTDDDGGVETPEPSDDDNSGPGGGDDDETPEPSESDHSGRGGGGDDD
jgi:hypothetical protein